MWAVKMAGWPDDQRSILKEQEKFELANGCNRFLRTRPASFTEYIALSFVNKSEDVEDFIS